MSFLTGEERRVICVNQGLSMNEVHTSGINSNLMPLVFHVGLEGKPLFIPEHI